MASSRLKKYLEYYYKTLREEPENVDAWLHIASLFREIDKREHAVDAYATASKLLAARGLGLEAIAVCKTALTLDPFHTTTQDFLVRLYAQAPREHVSRIARPVSMPAPEPDSSSPPEGEDDVVLAQLSADEMEAFAESGEEPIVLMQPKDTATTTSESSVASGEHISSYSFEEYSLEEYPHEDTGDGAQSAHDRPPRDEEDALAEGARAYEELEARVKQAAARTVEPPRSKRGPRAYVAPSPELLKAVAKKNSTRSTPPPLPVAVEDDSPTLEIASSYDQLEQLRAGTLEDPTKGESLGAGVDSLDKVDTRDAVRALRETIDVLSETEQEEYERIIERARAEAGAGVRLDTYDPPTRLDEAIPGPEQTVMRQVPIEVLRMAELSLEDDSDEILDIAAPSDLDSMNLTDASVSTEALERLGVPSELPEAASDLHATQPMDAVRPRIAIKREALPPIPLLGQLNAQGFAQMLREVRVGEYAPGELILGAEEEPRNTLFIIVSGTARATKSVEERTVELGLFQEGEFFGEFGLLAGRGGSATVEAVGATVVLELDEEVIDHIAEYDPEIWDALWAVYHVRMLNNMMVSDDILGLLSATRREEVIELFEVREYTRGEVLVEADAPCPFVCLVLFGELELVPSSPRYEPKVLGAGEFFGFVASLSDDPCKARIEVLQDATLWCLSARHFRTITRQTPAIAEAIRELLRERSSRLDLFLSTGIVSYADTGVN
ncbi:MAG: cyclic nucleotide-binding domain-containing protein [Myxococcota bacterium]